MPQGDGNGPDSISPKKSERDKENFENTNQGINTGGRGLGRGGGKGRRDGSGGGRGRGGGGHGGRRNQA